jgi:hypothetical protein
MSLYPIEMMGLDYVLKLVALWALVMLVASVATAVRRGRDRLGYIELTDPATRRAT